MVGKIIECPYCNKDKNINWCSCRGTKKIREIEVLYDYIFVSFFQNDRKLQLKLLQENDYNKLKFAIQEHLSLMKKDKDNPLLYKEYKKWTEMFLIEKGKEKE